MRYLTNNERRLISCIARSAVCTFIAGIHAFWLCRLPLIPNAVFVWIAPGLALHCVSMTFLATIAINSPFWRNVFGTFSDGSRPFDLCKSLHIANLYGIHPKRLQDILGILRDLVKEQTTSQVILTTHSPYVLDLFEPEEVSLCHMNSDGAVLVHRLSESQTVQEQLDIFTLGEIWTAEGDAALIPQGKSSETIS